MESIKSSRVLSLPTEGDFKRTFRFKLSPTPSLLLLSSERLELLDARLEGGLLLLVLDVYPTHDLKLLQPIYFFLAATSGCCEVPR